MHFPDDTIVSSVHCTQNLLLPQRVKAITRDLDRVAGILLNDSASRSLDSTSATYAQEDVMMNVRRGALALGLAALLSAAPQVASADTPLITNVKTTFVQPTVSCTGDPITITGDSDVIMWQRLVASGEWNFKQKVTQNGTATDAFGGSYHYHLSQTANFNLTTGADTIIVLRSMLTRLGEVGSPDDLSVRTYLHVVQNADGTTTVDHGSFEIECR